MVLGEKRKGRSNRSEDLFFFLEITMILGKKRVMRIFGTSKIKIKTKKIEIINFSINFVVHNVKKNF